MNSRKLPYSGLEVVGEEARLLELVVVRSGYRVNTCLVGRLEEVARQLEGREVAIAVPSSAVIRRKLRLAKGLRQRELALYLCANLERLTGVAAEELNMDFRVRGPVVAGEQEVELVAVRRQLLAEQVAPLRELGIRVAAVDVETLALARVVELVPEYQQQRLAVVRIEAEQGLFAVCYKGDCTYSQEFTINNDQSEQLEQQLQLYQETGAEPITQTIVLGGDNFNPFTRMQVAPQVAQQLLTPKLLLACGLALWRVR